MRRNPRFQLAADSSVNKALRRHAGAAAHHTRSHLLQCLYLLPHAAAHAAAHAHAIMSESCKPVMGRRKSCHGTATPRQDTYRYDAPVWTVLFTRERDVTTSCDVMLLLSKWTGKPVSCVCLRAIQGGPRMRYFLFDIHGSRICQMSLCSKLRGGGCAG